MPRAPFKSVELTEALRPVAAPVDSFVQAQVPSRDNNLQDLARSLSGLGGSLAGLIGQRDKQADEEDAIRGKAAFYQGNQQGFAEGVAAGAIPAQASPAFVRAYKQTEGEVAGGVLEQKFSSAYDQWEGKTNADPAAFDSFLGGFLKQNIGTNDPDILRGLLPKVEQLRANYLQRHIGDVSKSTMQGAIDAASAKDSQAIDAANTVGLSSQTGTDYQGVFSQIEANRAASLKVGMDRAKYDERVVDNITALAIKNRDPKLLDFLSRKVPGTDYSWDAAPYGRDQKQKAIDTLETMGRRSIADDEKKRREEKADLKDAVTRETIQAITKAPNDPIPEALLARGEKVDPDFRVNAIRWRDTIGKGTQTSDPQEILGVTTEVLNGGGVQAVQKAMARGVFKNASDLTTAYKLAEQMTKDGPQLDADLKGGSAKTILDTIKTRTAGDKDLGKLFDDGSVTAEGLQAQMDFKLQVLAWRQANPDASPIDREKAIGTIGAEVLKRIQQPEAQGPVGLDRAGLGTPNTFGAEAPARVNPTAPAPALAAPRAGPTFADPNVQVPSGLPGTPEAASPSLVQPSPSAPPPASSAQPVPQASQPEAVSAWLNALPPEMRSRLEVKAAEERKPLLLKAQEVYERGVASGAIKAPAAPATVPTPAQPPGPGRQTMRAPDGTPIETASAQGPEADAATRDVMAAFQRSAGPAVSREQAAKAPRIEGGAPPTPIPASLVTEKGPTPVPAQSAVAVVDDGPRGHINHGVISLKGADGSILGQYRFVNGGGGAGTIPHGAYEVSNYRDTATRKAQGLGNLGETFDLSDVFDARAGRERTALRIHQAHGDGTLGCIGIQGGEAAWQDFSKKMQGLVAEGGGKYTLVLGSETGGTGQAQGGDAQAAFTRALSSTARPSTFASPEVQADPRAARILDMVSGAELKGANPGNYNAVYGNAAATKDLSKRTLDQTIAWSKDRGTASSATGRYQFMAETLESLKKDLKLTGSEAFTPALQDRMALALLNRRGYREWSTGKLSTEDFAANLAKEWASLPNPATGQSYYQGDGRNKALISPARLRAALTGTGAFPGAALEAAGKAAIAKPSVFERVRGMFGGGSASAAGPAADAYSNAPKPEVAERLRAISPNPVASSDAILSEVAPNLAAAIKKAQTDNPKLRIVVVARSGEGAEVWPADAQGRVSFDPAQQDAVGAAVRRSASQLGFGVNILGGTGGGRTHIEVAPTTRA